MGCDWEVPAFIILHRSERPFISTVLPYLCCKSLLCFRFFSGVSIFSCKLLIPMRKTVRSLKQFVQGWFCPRPLPSLVPKPFSVRVMHNLCSKAVTDCRFSLWQTSIWLKLTLGEQLPLAQLPQSATFTNT